ncbi:MAG: EAL domain-containing protein [Pseudomonadota bacterium]
MDTAYAWGTYVLAAIMVVAIGLMIAATMKFYRVGIGRNNNHIITIIVLTSVLVIIASFLLFLIFINSHLVQTNSSFELVSYLAIFFTLLAAIIIWQTSKFSLNASNDLKKSSALEHYYTTHDDLTGLPNLSFFNDQLEKTLNYSRREDDVFALLIIGLNRFKVINETLGYFVGDAILQEIAHRIRKALRKSDLIARLGGDEFTVLINPVEAQGHIHTISKNIAESIQEPLAVEGKPADVGVSIGVAIYPKHAKNSVTLIEKARNAMMVAERHGHAVFVYDDDAADSQIQDIQIIGMLQRAIQDEQLKVLYQPQVRLNDEKIISAEALIRWQHPSYGLLDPGRFIPYAEKAGLIFEINLWLLNKVVALLIDWHDKNIQIPIAFNITANGFLNNDFQHALNTHLKKYDWLAEKIKIELTETSSIEHIEEIHEAMLNYKKKGLGFSLDDYGTKHASLEYLKHLPFDELKIDQSFMVNAVIDEDSRAIIQHAKEIAGQLKLVTTAEGIENKEVLEIAKAFSIENGQGFYFSVAVEANSLEPNLL